MTVVSVSCDVDQGTENRNAGRDDTDQGQQHQHPDDRSLHRLIVDAEERIAFKINPVVIFLSSVTAIAVQQTSYHVISQDRKRPSGFED